MDRHVRTDAKREVHMMRHGLWRIALGLVLGLVVVATPGDAEIVKVEVGVSGMF